MIPPISPEAREAAEWFVSEMVNNSSDNYVTIRERSHQRAYEAGRRSRDADLDEIRDSVLLERGPMEGEYFTSEQINAALGLIDEHLTKKEGDEPCAPTHPQTPTTQPASAPTSLRRMHTEVALTAGASNAPATSNPLPGAISEHAQDCANDLFDEHSPWWSPDDCSRRIQSAIDAATAENARTISELEATVKEYKEQCGCPLCLQKEARITELESQLADVLEQHKNAYWANAESEKIIASAVKERDAALARVAELEKDRLNWESPCDARRERDQLRSELASTKDELRQSNDRLSGAGIWSTICAHHTHAERASIKCPVCAEQRASKLVEALDKISNGLTDDWSANMLVAAKKIAKEALDAYRR